MHNRTRLWSPRTTLGRARLFGSELVPKLGLFGGRLTVSWSTGRLSEMTRLLYHRHQRNNGLPLLLSCKRSKIFPVVRLFGTQAVIVGEPEPKPFRPFLFWLLAHRFKKDAPSRYRFDHGLKRYSAFKEPLWENEPSTQLDISSKAGSF